MSKQTFPIEIVRHSLAHVLAMAVLDLRPDTKLGIGPAIENGFYYDFGFRKKITADDLEKIEERMIDFIKTDFKFEREEITPEKAKKIFSARGGSAFGGENQLYKLELIEELAKEKKSITIYKTCPPAGGSGEFIDLCAGPHVSSTKDLRSASFKLEKIAGAYWKGSEKNPMLTRIYAAAFESLDELKNYLNAKSEAEKRDHRKLGKDLGLFVFSDLVGPGLPLYTFKGALVRRMIQNYSVELRKKIGYSEVHTPQMNKAELFKISGHYDKYKDGMFKVISNYTEEEYYLKPMNCPQHTQIYASQMRSYRDLPVRVADFSMLYRDEKPGELNGLVRLRAFSQDDGHCFCREDQIKNEFSSLLNIIEEAMRTYKMDYFIRLSLRDEKNKEKYLGNDAAWKKSQKILEDLLKEKKIEHVRAEGEAAFYGPKMDVIAKDSLGREWQLSTIQLDFNMPGRFGLEYTGEDGKKHTPVMIHSAIVGSPERFLGILIEHHAGAFPVWLAPIQTEIIPLSEKFNDYGKKIFEMLEKENIRPELDINNETLGKKIREAELQKIPYILVVGDKEEKSETVAVRQRGKGDLGAMKIDDFIKKIKIEIEQKLSE
ncbi:MAG: threonine--tRNA ligase [bacterium]|nr:threonine--tRNA ligase [bacterium]